MAALIAEHPRILENLTRILSDRLAATTARVVDTRARGEAIALVVSQEAAGAPGRGRGNRSGKPRPVATLDVRESLDELEKLDDLLAANGTVLVVADPGRPRPRRQPTARNARRATCRRRSARPRSVAHEARSGPGRRRSKGYAHVAVLRVLEDAGYTVDYVAARA